MLLAVTWWYIHLAPHKIPSTHSDFIWGLVHGFLAVVNFVYSLFNNRVTIYQAPNTGAGYNFGFLLGLALFASFIGFGARRSLL